jgi:hypothetical protein
MKRIIILLNVFLLFPILLLSQNTQSTISGFIYEESNGEAIIGANVFIEGLPIGSATNHSGYYVIPEVPPGIHVLLFEYLGYKTERRDINIKEGENIKLNMLMIEDVLETEVIEVVADSIPTIEKLYRKPISEISLTPKQINQIPQVAEADLLRTLQTLPGILPLSDFSSALYVRGGTSDQNLYLLDGTDVYNPEHAFGLFSTFNTDAIKQVDLSKGGFGAEFGGRLSSVLNITNLDGNREEFEGETAISLLSAKTTLQMPIGNFGSISGSVRRTYFDQTVAKMIDDIPDYYFYDANVKAFLDLDPNNKLTLSFYGGRDVLDVIFNPDSPDKIGFGYDWGNKTGSIRWTKVFNPTLFSNFWLTASRFSSYFDLDEINIFEENTVTDITFKGNLEYHISNQFATKFGFEQKNLHISYKQDFPGGAVDVTTNPEHYIVYFQGNWRPNSRWDIEGGLRFNYFDTDTSFNNFAPRFSAKYKLTEKINLKAAAGIYYQYLQRVPRFIVSDIWTNSNKYQNQSSSYHYILGYQQEFDKDYEFEFEVYYKDYKNIYAFNQTFNTEITPGHFNGNNEPVYTETKGLFNRGDGHSIGFELLMRKDVGNLTGWIGYSYSHSSYNFEGINQGRAFAPRHDRASTLNFVSSYNLSGQPEDYYQGTWHLGMNFVYSSGQPFTEPGSGYITGSAPGAPVRYVEYAPTKINNIRFPYYGRLDLSITYKKNYSYITIEPYIQVFNVGNRKNVWFVNYEYQNGIPDVEEQHMLPILPTLGIKLKF